MVPEALVSIAAAAIAAILKKVLSLAASEVVLAWGYQENLIALHKTLELISAVLDDAEKQKSREGVILVWLKQLKHAVDEADDVLDEIHYQALKREVKTRDWMSRNISSLPSLKKITFRISMGHKIENVSKKLFEINKQAKNLGLQHDQPGSVPNSLFRETDPYFDEFKVVGRESDELHIIQLLTKSKKEDQLTIVPIVGMGGIGKTTLAKSIYNKPTIEQHFDVKAWLCVSVKVDVDTLLAKIYESLAEEECKSLLRPNIITNLQRILGSKRYFLVLDDVWEEAGAYWDHFKSSMLKVNSQNGSAILVTTRIRSIEIGTKAMSEDFHALQSLPDHSCWSIFKERAYVDGRSPLPELEEIGHDIVKKCRGLPLLVNVMGGKLRNCNDKEKWLSIKDGKVWDLEEEGNRVQNIMKLSFDNLPNSTVKQCFLYCSIFQKDAVLEREELIRLWMALGLVQADERRNKEAEDVGNDIFQILVGSSLFQDVKTDEYGYVTGCMHDLVHDLSLSLCKDESLCLVDPNIERIPEVKHLSLMSHDKRFKTKITLNNMATRTLRTFILDGVIVENISFRNFNNLRILKLKGSVLEKIDDSIGELVHLRYLDLSKSAINALPNSICKLYHLQTLNLIGCYSLKKLPENTSNLKSLRHLMYGQFAKGSRNVSRYKLYDNFDRDFLIHKVGRLTSLRTLPFFKVGREKRCQIKELGRLKHLAGELCITNLEKINNKEDAAKADLSQKKSLYGIHLCWSEYNWKGVNREKDVLEGLQPHEQVKVLTIQNFSGDNFPTWVDKMAIDVAGKWTPLDKLVKIKLFGCNNCACLPMLEDLPFLRDLVLEKMDKLTCLSSSSGQGAIKPLSPSLISLKLILMRRLKYWNTDSTTTNSSIMLSPVLKSLTICECPNIIHLDECHPHPLVSLRISRCENLVAFKSIQGLTSLETLEITSCHSLLEIPYLHNSKCHPLKRLSVMKCTKLTSLPCELFECFSFLTSLGLGWFSKELNYFPCLQGIKSLRNLYLLELYGWHHWDSVPKQVQHLTSLTYLCLSGFGMRELPSWLTNMSSIRWVSFHDCKKLNENEIERRIPRESTQIRAPTFVLDNYLFL